MGWLRFPGYRTNTPRCAPPEQPNGPGGARRASPPHQGTWPAQATRVRRFLYDAGQRIKESPLSIDSTYVGALTANKLTTIGMMSTNHAGRNAGISGSIMGAEADATCQRPAPARPASPLRQHFTRNEDNGRPQAIRIDKSIRGKYSCCIGVHSGRNKSHVQDSVISPLATSCFTASSVENSIVGLSFRSPGCYCTLK